jgi:PTH1 family peptidyl-tRNA hydrolase
LPRRESWHYDDFNIDLGRVKVTTSGSAGGHNGVASLLEHLGDGFVRYRLGIGPKEPPQMDIKDFVLGKFTTEQLNLIEQTLDHIISTASTCSSRAGSIGP